MILGQYESKIGDKHRVAVPSKIRDILRDKLIITKGLEQHLIIITEEQWKTLLEGTEGKPFTEKATREMQRYLLGNATHIELDQKGRFVLPEYLREYAGLTEDIIYAGIGRFVELWDKGKWEEQQTYLSKNIESIAEKLSRNEAGNG